MGGGGVDWFGLKEDWGAGTGFEIGAGLEIGIEDGDVGVFYGFIYGEDWALCRGYAGFMFLGDKLCSCRSILSSFYFIIKFPLLLLFNELDELILFI